jgi:hypothetical protein
MISELQPNSRSNPERSFPRCRKTAVHGKAGIILITSWGIFSCLIVLGALMGIGYTVLLIFSTGARTTCTRHCFLANVTVRDNKDREGGV